MTTATTARRGPRARAATRPPFDRDALLAEREDALNETLLMAADLPALTAAMKRLLSANVQLHLQRELPAVFEKFELRFEDRSFRADAYATLHLTLSFLPELTVNAPWLGERDLLEGLPKFNNYGTIYSVSLLKAEHSAVTGSFDLRVRASDDDGVRFVMFELTVAQLHSSAQAWRTTSEALVEQERTRLSRGNTSEAKAFKALADLETRHAALTQELADLEAELSAARTTVQGVRSALASKVSKAAPPLLKHLNALRAQLGLKEA